MKYRQFGKLDWKGSALGFGCMRLPLLGKTEADVDVEESIKMIRYAIDHGVNYVDTAYPYHGGKSEVILGQALKDGYREKVKLATKSPSWMISKTDDFERLFNEQLERLKVNKVDYYLLHGLNRGHWPRIPGLKVFDWAEKKIAAGQIGRIGFSFHDDYATFKEIVDGYDNWVLAQIQLNYMDTNYQAGTRGLKYASGKGLAVVVMEPLQGGNLAKKPPEGVARVWAEAKHKRSPAEWALLWVWEHPQVSVVLSGMSDFQQVVEDVKIAEKAGPGALNSEEQALIKRARKVFEELSPIGCTNCGYCMPCQHGVEIPQIFKLYNNAMLYDDMAKSRRLYAGPPFRDGQRASDCKECDTCAEKCPQKLPVKELLKKAHAALKPQ